MCMSVYIHVCMSVCTCVCVYVCVRLSQCIHLTDPNVFQAGETRAVSADLQHGEVRLPPPLHR